MIATFYSGDLPAFALLAFAGFIVALIAFGKTTVRSLAPNLTVALLTWFAVLRSGINATLAALSLPCASPGPKAGNDETQLFGASYAACIGGTMTLFTEGPAFTGNSQTAGVRKGVPLGSLVSAYLALAILRSLPILKNDIPSGGTA